MTAPQVVQNHPNATLAAGAGGAAGTIIWIASSFGVTVPGTVGAYLATIIAATALAVGRRGIRGIARVLWRGNNGS